MVDSGRMQLKSKLRVFIICAALAVPLFFEQGCDGVGTAILDGKLITNGNGDPHDGPPGGPELDGAGDPLSPESEEIVTQLQEVPNLIKNHYPHGGSLTQPGLLVIYGDGFLNGLKVFVGIKECTNVVITNKDMAVIADQEFAGTATQRIQCSLPDNITAESKDVVVVLPNSTFGKSPNKFTYENDQIAVAQDFQKFKRNWNRNYTLANNLDMAGVKIPATKYYFGVFDGGGKTISNLTITANNIGVSGFVSILHGTIKNLILQQPTLEHTFANNVAASQHAVGIVAGFMMNTSTITGVNVVNSQYKHTDPNTSFLAGIAPISQAGAVFTNNIVNGGAWVFTVTANYDMCLDAATNGATGINLTGTAKTLYFSGTIGASNVTGNLDSGGCDLVPNNITY